MSTAPFILSERSMTKIFISIEIRITFFSLRQICLIYYYIFFAFGTVIHSFIHSMIQSIHLSGRHWKFCVTSIDWDVNTKGMWLKIVTPFRCLLTFYQHCMFPSMFRIRSRKKFTWFIFFFVPPMQEFNSPRLQCKQKSLCLKLDDIKQRYKMQNTYDNYHKRFLHIWCIKDLCCVSFFSFLKWFINVLLFLNPQHYSAVGLVYWKTEMQSITNLLRKL